MPIIMTMLTTVGTSSTGALATTEITSRRLRTQPGSLLNLKYSTLRENSWAFFSMSSRLNKDDAAPDQIIIFHRGDERGGLSSVASRVRSAES